MARFASGVAALLVTGTLLVTGCLDGTTSGPVGPTVRIDIRTAYDPDMTRPEYRQYGFEPGTPARHGAVIVRLVTGTPGSTESSDTAVCSEEAEAGSVLTVPEGRSEYYYCVPLDGRGQVTVRPELQSAGVDVSIRLNPLQSVFSPDCPDLRFVTRAAVDFRLEEARDVTVRYGVSCVPDS